MMLSRTVSLVSRRSGALVAPAAPRLAAVPMTLHRRAYASSSPDSFPQLPPGFEKLAHSPTALSAIQNLVELMKKNGVDLTSGEKPSMWQLMKLATNSEVKTATSKGKLPITFPFRPHF